MSIGAQILGEITRTEEIISDAMRTGNDALALRGVRVKVSTLALMADRLGIEKADAVAGLQDAEDLWKAVASALRSHPEVGEPIAAALDEAWRDDVAEAIRSAASRFAEDHRQEIAS